MKTVRSVLVFFGFFWLMGIGHAQVTVLGNVGGGPEYLGWSAANLFPLNISHQGNQFININQNNIARMRFQNLNNWTGLNGAAGVNQNRVMLSSNGTFQGTPMSILQLGSNLNNALQRNWMNVGTTYGSNLDIMYVGLIDRPTTGSVALTDAAFAWGCNDNNFSPGAGPDNMRFIFITPIGNTAGLGDNQLGREVMRITPMGNVGIGDFSGTDVTVLGQPQSKLDIYNSFALQEYAPNGIRLRNFSQGLNTVSASAVVVNMNTSGGVAGVQRGLEVTTTGGFKNYSGYFLSTAVAQSGDNFGVFGESVGLNSGYTTGNLNSGLTGAGWFGESAFGVRGNAQFGDVRNIAIYGRVDNNDPGAWAAWFDGRTWCTQGIWGGSDESLKENVEPFTNSLDVLSALPVYSYNYNSTAQSSLNFDEGVHLGIMAQDLSEQLPHLVIDAVSTPTPDNPETIQFKAINYLELIPVLIAAVQELRAENAEIRTQLSNCCSTQSDASRSTESTTSHQVSLKNRSIVLSQNVPNPFAERTEIDYFIERHFTKAELYFYDQSGKMIEIVPILSEGRGSVSVFAENLSSGQYSYALVIDGVIVETRLMIKN